MLQKWLKSLGVSSYSELNQEEKETYKIYEEALSGRKLTDDEVEKWLQSELEIAISRVTDIDLKKEDEIFRKVEVRLLKKIINFINSPKIAKEFAEKSISEMIK